MSENSQARILVVEDDLLARDMIIRRLSKRGFEVEDIKNGSACLERLGRDPMPDLILMDIHMPGASGLEVTERVRERWTRDQLPIIMVTALADADDVVKGLKAGANDYVVKPIVMPVLMARIGVSLSVKLGVMRLLEAERQRVMLESMGAACHHISQPMTATISKLAMMIDDPPADPNVMRDDFKEMYEWVEQVANILHRLQVVSTYRTVPYITGQNIIDIHPPTFPADNGTEKKESSRGENPAG